jgi:hypothetical protein
MKDLIESLTIISEYMPRRPAPANPDMCLNQQYPTHCDHDVMLVPSIRDEIWAKIPIEVKGKLSDLGWEFLNEYNCIGSFRYGSA